jgi:hypothetical protein
MKRLAISIALLSMSLLVVIECMAHGYLHIPESRGLGNPRRDYQFCFDPPGCECGQFRDAGPIVANYEAGETIHVTLNITLAHVAGDLFSFQLCPPDAISEECFEAGTIASFHNDGTVGLNNFEFQIPPDTQCDPCVLRWKWE